MCGSVTLAAAKSASIAGLASVVVLGVVREGTLTAGLDLLTVAGSPSLDLGSFVVAPLVSWAVAVAVARQTPVPTAPVS